MNPIKRLAGQTVIYGLSSIVGRLLNYLLVPLYTRVFVTSEYGVVTELYAYVALFFVVLTYGMETAFFRFSTSERNPKPVYSTALISVLISSAGFIILGFLSARQVADWLGYSAHPEYIVWFVLILALDALTAIPFARLRQENKALRFALVKLVNIASNIGLNLFFILWCPYVMHHSQPGFMHDLVLRVYNPDIGVGYIFLSNLASSLLTLILLVPQLTDIKYVMSRPLWRKMMAYALPLLILGLAGSINESFDRILLKHLLPDKATAMAQLGIYGACYKISIIMTIFIQTFRFAAEPFFFGESKNRDAKVLYARVMNYFVIVCAFIFLVTMLYMDIVKHFVGVRYYSGLSVVPILLLANMCLGIFYNLSIWYKLTNQTMFGAWISVIGAVITLVLNFWLIPLIGYMGSAWATLICYFAMMVMSYYLGQKYYPVKYNVTKFLVFTGGAVALYFAGLLLDPGTRPLRLLVNTGLLAVFIVLVGAVERKEWVHRKQ